MLNFGDIRLPQRFWDRVIPEPNSSCWLWLGRIEPHGYARLGGKLAHRITYAIEGTLDARLVLDHLCRVTCCVNPAHLDQVTNAVNIQRGLNATRTHCNRGHRFSIENTGTYRGRRICRACDRLRHKQSYWRAS